MSVEDILFSDFSLLNNNVKYLQSIPITHNYHRWPLEIYYTITFILLKILLDIFYVTAWMKLQKCRFEYFTIINIESTQQLLLYILPSDSFFSPFKIAEISFFSSAFDTQWFLKFVDR